MSERQTKRRRKADNVFQAWCVRNGVVADEFRSIETALRDYGTSLIAVDTNEHAQEVWLDNITWHIGGEVTTTVRTFTSAQPDAGLTVDNLRQIRDAMRVMEMPPYLFIDEYRVSQTHWLPADIDDFNPLFQGYRRPLEELVGSVLDYEGLGEDFEEDDR